MYPYFEILGKTFTSYGLMAFIGIGAVFGYSALINIKSKSDYFSRLVYLVYSFIFSLICAAFLYQITVLKNTITAFHYLFSDFNTFKSMMSYGIVYYGGMFGIFIGMLVYTKQFNEDTREWFRTTIPSIPLFHVFGRIGCSLGGCCYGKEVSEGGIYNKLIDKYCLPIQLYEAAGDFIIFLILLIFVLRQKNKEEYYKPAGLYFVLYGLLRFILEFWRGDSIRGIWGLLSTSQYISLFIIPLGIYCLIIPAKKNFLEKWYNGRGKKKIDTSASLLDNN